MEILDLLDFGKYFVIGIAVIGVIVFMVGVFRQVREQIIGGLLIILCAAAIGLCGYLIYKNMEHKVYETLDEIYVPQEYL